MTMMNCPKCGFSQPRDQYCASCGIDMVAYRPKGKPFHKRVLSNTLFQLFTLTAVVLSFFFVIRHQQKMEIAARINDIESAAPAQLIERSAQNESAEEPAADQTELASNGEAAPPASPEAEASSPDESVSSATVAAAPAPRAASAPATDSAAKPATGEGAPSTSPTAAAAKSASIRVSFNEAPRALINEIASEPEANAGSYGSLQYGIATDWVNRSRTFRSAVNWRSLDTTEPQTLQAGETTTVYRGPRDEASGEAYGVWVYAKLVRVDEQGATVQIEVSRNLTDPGATGSVDQVNRLPLAEMTVPRGGAAYVTGLVPHRRTELSAQELRLYRNDRVLQVLTSEPFRSGLTDLAIFVEPVLK